ncbi:MAG: polymer-forming cytoskeletal protein [Spirochaetales bacterium]
MPRRTNRTKETDAPRIRTRLGRDTFLKGTLRFRESVEISGRLEGKIAAEGFLIILDGAEVRADISARDIVVGGTVHGNIEALHRLEVLETGKIYGNVRTSEFRVADGVVFEGRCEMIRDAESIDVFASPIDQVRESIRGG